jgi:hypothetical protein
LSFLSRGEEFVFGFLWFRLGSGFGFILQILVANEPLLGRTKRRSGGGRESRLKSTLLVRGGSGFKVGIVARRGRERVLRLLLIEARDPTIATSRILAVSSNVVCLAAAGTREAGAAYSFMP